MAELNKNGPGHKIYPAYSSASHILQKVLITVIHTPSLVEIPGGLIVLAIAVDTH